MEHKIFISGGSGGQGPLKFLDFIGIKFLQYKIENLFPNSSGFFCPLHRVTH